MLASTERILSIVVLGVLLGLTWNQVSGRGIALDRNAYVQDADEVIGPEEAKARYDRGAVFLDAREVESYRAEHVAGALSLPEREFERAFPGLAPTLRTRFDLVVYCGGLGCEASHQVSRWLRQRGIQAAIFEKGLPVWTGAGYPTRKGDTP